MSVVPTVFYAYPEALPTMQARGVSVVNTVSEWMSFNDNLKLIVGESSRLDAVNHHYQVNIQSDKLSFLSKRFLLKTNKIYIWRLKRLIRQNPGCVVYTRHLKVASALIADGSLHCSVFYEVHEFFYHSVDTADSVRRGKLKSIEAQVFEGATGLVFWNHNLERLAIKEFPHLQAKRLVATSGIRNVPHSLVASDKPQDRLVYLGSLKAWKGVERLISVFPKTGFSQLAIVGGSSEEISTLKKQCHDLGVAEQVEFLGSISNLEAQQWLIDEASIAVIPLIGGRYAEFSTPIKLFEYMSAGAVVVCPELATVTDYVRDGVEVLCFNQDSNESLIDVLRSVRSLALGERDALSAAAKRRSADFTWRRRAERIHHFTLNPVSDVKAS